MIFPETYSDYKVEVGCGCEAIKVLFIRIIFLTDRLKENKHRNRSD